MSIISEVPEIRDSVVLMSVDFYHASSDLGWIDENTELLRGIPVGKMSKSPEHEYLVRLILRQLEALLPEGHFVSKGSPLTALDSEPEPDIMLVEGEERDFRGSHPTTAKIVVEVAISTVQRDESKASIYAEAGVGEYWLVTPEKKQVTVYRNSNGKEYEQIDKNTSGEIKSSVLEGFSIQVPQIFE